MTTITLPEVELLASLLARAGVTQIEAMWANIVLDKLRAIAAACEAAQAKQSSTPK